MSSALVAVVIPGTPKPQGSLRPVTSRSTGRLFVKHPAGMRDYREFVASALGRERAVGSAHSGPVSATATFAFPRPVGHWRPANRRRPVRELRETAPAYPIGRAIPDLDKLQRLLGDALQLGGVLVDDGQIVEWQVDKVWTDEPHGHAVVAVYPVGSA